MATVSEVTIGNILTRTTGYLKTVSSHSLQPYRGCSYGNSLCGVGCYVQHNGHILKGRDWGGFLEVRTNAAESYLTHAPRERRWARRHGQSQDSIESADTGSDASIGRFSIFLSSSTDPFVPQESRFRVSESVLTAMLTEPPDVLILQTHSHLVERYVDLLQDLSQQTELRVHISIETDRESFPGLPPHASPVQRRLDACRTLKKAGLRTVVTVSPLLPIAQPQTFFGRIAEVADAVVIDHFILGDGSDSGHRTWRTQLPEAMRAVDPESVTLAYRNHIIATACGVMPGHVGVSSDGFAGRMLTADGGQPNTGNQRVRRLSAEL